MMLLALLSVLCAFSALTAQPYDAKVQNIGIFKVWDNYKEMQHVAYVQRRMANILSQVVERVRIETELLYREVPKFVFDFNDIIRDLTAKAAATGVDVADCTALQDQLPQIKDKLRAELKQCIERELKLVNDDVQGLESVSPKLDAILDEVQKDGVDCKARYGSLIGWWCAGKAWDKYKERADTVIDEADPLILDAYYNYDLIESVRQCWNSKASPATATQANDVVTCFQSKLNKV